MRLVLQTWEGVEVSENDIRIEVPEKVMRVEVPENDNMRAEVSENVIIALVI